MPASSESSAVNNTPSPSLRKIEFHLARKPVSFSPNVNPNFKLQTLNPNSSSNFTPCSSNSDPNPRNRDPSDSIEDAVLAFRMPLRRIGAGLVNLGNTCFLNSVIQCLTYTEPLVGYLQSDKHQNTCRVAGFCALCAIQNHVTRALQASGRIVAPKDLVSNLRCISRNFRNARQEDAHEYMIHLLESMHKCCLPSGIPAESPGAYEKSLVHRIFGGRLRSQVKCLQCSYCSNTFDAFLDLSLEIVKADTLSKAIRNFTAPELLDGGERHYKCEKCKQKVRALKQLTVCKAPYVLTIHLKRFRSHFSGQKIDKKVQFDSTLDLKPFFTGDYEGDLTYKLYGVLVHAGWSTHSGHYYCFVRTSNGLWYSLDDNKVIQVSERIVMEQKAYMLFYVRDQKKIVSKKAMDIVQQGNMMATMRNVSSSISGVNHPAAEKNSTCATQSGTIKNHLQTSKPSDVVVQPNLSRNMKLELNKSLGEMSPEALCVKTDNLSIPKANLNAVIDSTKFTENSQGANLPGFSSDSNNTPKSDHVLLDEKPLSLDCPSSVANGVGGISSDVVMDDKPLTIVSSVSIIQGNTKGESRKSSKLSQSRIKGKRLDKLITGRGLVKKISKSRALGMHLSTKILYVAAFSSRKRKKCKKMKQQAELLLQENFLNGKVVPARTSSPVVVASTSVGNNYTVDTGKKDYDPCSREQEKDDSQNVINTNCKLPLVADKVLNSTEEADSDTVRVSGKLSNEPINMELQCNIVGGSSPEKQNFQPQSGILKETTVVRWEGVQSPSENAAEIDPEIVTIGHVLDEWDEEYDRGKRKKVRGLKNNFDGPNLFQEISSKKAKLKAKAGQCIFKESKIEPFRI